jgi:hypothetical protein
MAHNRNKNRYAKTLSPAPQPQGHPTSSAAEIVAKRIARGGVDYINQNLIRTMTGSIKLSEEPEFLDIKLDGEKIIKVSQRWFQKYEKRLATAKKKDPDKYHEVFDKMRIEVVAELATPAFRKDVDNRLQALCTRLMATDDVEKLEMVLMLKPLLEMKSVPWGLCGLILGIFSRSMQKEFLEYDEEKGVYDALAKAFKSENGDSFDMVKAIESPKELKQLGQKLLAGKPGLRQRMEKQAWDIVIAFEKDLVEGRVILDLFTEAELDLPFQRLEAEVGEAHTQAQSTEEMTKSVFDAILQTINEIMTSERLQRLREDVQSTAKVWFREQQKWAAALQFELVWLDGGEYDGNKFILTAFLGQLFRVVKDQEPAPKPRKRNH